MGLIKIIASLWRLRRGRGARRPFTLNLRPDLWEMSISSQGSGMPPIPPEALARLTPEQRARFEAAMAARMAGGDKPHVYKSCITETTLQRGFDTGESNAHRKCPRTLLSSTASTMDRREECTDPRAHMSGHFHFAAPNPVTVNGNTDFTVNDGSHSMAMKQVIHGKWVAADCGQYAHSNFGLGTPRRRTRLMTLGRRLMPPCVRVERHKAG